MKIHNILNLISTKCKILGFTLHKLLTDKWLLIVNTRDADKINSLKVKADRSLDPNRKKFFIFGSYIYLLGEIVFLLIVLYAIFK